MKKTYRQNRETGELYEVVRTKAEHRHFVGDSFSDFVSPVDGSHIANEKQLAEHNKRHGVSNDLDHLREQSTNRPRQETSHDRKLAIKDAMEKVASSGFYRQERYDG